MHLNPAHHLICCTPHTYLLPVALHDVGTWHAVVLQAHLLYSGDVAMLDDAPSCAVYHLACSSTVPRIGYLPPLRNVSFLQASRAAAHCAALAGRAGLLCAMHRALEGGRH